MKTACIALLLLLLTLPTAVQAQFNYATNNDGTITITKYTGSNTVVNIPSTINGMSVTSIGDEAFGDCYRLTSVTIPESVTTVVKDAFRHCINLENIAVNWNNSVYSSGYGALFNKSQTTLIKCPECTFSYRIPESVTNIGDWAFANCRLAGIWIHNNVTSIGADAFSHCVELTSARIGRSVTNIGDCAFAACTNLTSVYLQGNAPSVGRAHVFNGDDKATIYYLPGTTGWESTFGGCPTMLWESFTYKTNSPDTNTITITSYIGPDDAVSITFPCIINGLSVTSIGDGALGGCYFTSIIIPNSVTNIGDGTFANSRLTNVIIPDSVATIGEAAFCCSYDLENIKISRRITNIPSGVLASCWGLTNIIIPDNVTNIGSEAFSACHCLSNVVIGAKVVSIGKWAFQNCNLLTSIYFQGNAPRFGLDAFKDDTKATIYYLPETTGWGSTFAGHPTAVWKP